MAGRHERPVRPHLLPVRRAAAYGLLALVAGLALGHLLGGERGARAQGDTRSPPAVVTSRAASPPPVCVVALDKADATISYLVAGVRDERLAPALQAYVASAYQCRKTRGVSR